MRPLAASLLVSCSLSACVGGGAVPGREPPLFQRLVKAEAETVRDAARAALAAEQFTIDVDDPEAGTIGGFQRRRIRSALEQDDLLDEIREIARLDEARIAEPRAVSQYVITHRVEATAAGADRTRLSVRSEIAVVESMIAGPFVVPAMHPVESRGVVERRLLEEIADRVYLGDEMLYELGTLGRD